MKRGRSSVLAMFILGASLASTVSHAQNYPSKPVSIIVPSAAGGGPDVIARIVADGLGQRFGRQFVILNRPGAEGVIAAEAIAKAPADGYTLYMPLTSTFVTLPLSHPDMPLDLLHDLAPVGLIGEQPLVIAVSPKLAIKSLQDLINLAKSKPGVLNYAGATRGGLPNLAAELLWSRTGISLTFVQYKGTAGALPDVAAGRVSVVIDAMSALVGAITGKTVYPLAVASAHRLPEFPGLATVSETVPGFEAKGWFALMAPAKTKPDIVEGLSAALRFVLSQPATIAKLQALGAYTHILSSEQMAQYIRNEQALWQPVVRKFGVLPQ